MIPYIRDFSFEYGRYDQLNPLVGRVVARNPGPFTFTGTGTYVVGRPGKGSAVAVIDPGPTDRTHLNALLAAVEGRHVTHVLLTHTHRDHCDLAREFADRVEAPIFAALPASNSVQTATSLDEDEHATFVPDHRLVGGECIQGDTWSLNVMATPGHASNHLTFALTQQNALFCGDHVMGWSTTVVAPPDGDMTSYLASLDAVIDADFATLWPTHGAPILDPAPFLRAYRDHRLHRESQIMARLSAAPQTISDLVPPLYADVDERLWPAAGLSVHAHLIKLVRERLVRADPGPILTATYRLV